MPLLEEALLLALEEERKLSEERALLPGLLQHDLANVLCQVSLSASVLATAPNEAERARCVRDVLGGVRRMNELLTGMKFLFLTRAGAADFQRGDLASFVASIVQSPGVWPAGTPIRLDLPVKAVCSYSPTLLRHALVNLIGNAVLYSRESWVRVRLARIRGARWQLTVANGGPGIPANHLPYLFDLAPSAISVGKSAGAGIGLYLARMCLRLHGSQLRLRTRRGLTVFSFPVIDTEPNFSAAARGARDGFPN